MLIFIDCEFSDLIDMDLISIALVAEDGKEFYAEVPFDVRRCNDFVKETVLPLLGKYPDARCDSVETLRSRLEVWLSQFDQAVILYDYFGDMALFFEIFENNMPANARRCISIQEKISQDIRDEYFMRDGTVRHHALCDAKANKYAYERK